MADTTVLAGQRESAYAEPWWRWAIVGGLIILLYFSILKQLAVQWSTDDDFSHGFFVPLFSAFVLWSDRERWRSARRSPSWLGLPVIVGSLLVLVVGVLGAELFLSRSSFVLLLAGLLLYFFGWAHFRVALFPWAFLFLMIPIPRIVFNQVAFPLQFLASKLAAAQLALLGVPVLREGNVIHLPAMSLEVAEACSGIRSLMSLFTLAIIYGYFLEKGLLRRTLLALGAVPIAVIANAFRVTGTGLLGQYWDPQKAEGFFHSFSGWLIFVISLAMLFALHGLFRVTERWWHSRRSRART